VPRLLKLLHTAGFAEDHLTLVAIDNTEEQLKRSPGGEEAGHEVYRVPTVIVTRGGQEVNRFVEHPVLSLERDLLAIFSGEPYEASYTSYPVVRRWLRGGLLADPNVSPHGLADQVRSDIYRESELNAAARVLQSRGDVREAVTLFRVNCELYPDSSRAFTHLARGLVKLGEGAEAREAAEKALRLNKDPDAVGDLVDLIAGIGD
jgi:tetratricopeptide (TPR) repeat protein